MVVDTNIWHAPIELFWNVSMGSSFFYLTKCFRCILQSFLLLLITLLLLFVVHLYDENLGLVAFLSLGVDLVSIKGNFFSKFSDKNCAFSHVRIFFVHNYPSY